MFVWTVDVGWTDVRPVVPDQHVSRVQVAADDEVEAMWLAAAMVMRPALVVDEDWVPNQPRRSVVWQRAVQMPTSTSVVSVVM